MLRVEVRLIAMLALLVTMLSAGSSFRCLLFDDTHTALVWASLSLLASVLFSMLASICAEHLTDR